MIGFIERLGRSHRFGMIQFTKMTASIKENNVYKSIRAHYDRT